MAEGPGFTRPRHDNPTPHLLLGNVGGLDEAALQQLLAPYGGVLAILPAGPERGHAFASFATQEAAAAALKGLDGAPGPTARGGALVVRFAEARQQKSRPPEQLPAVLSVEDAGVPGLELYPEFVSLQEEAQLLALADARPWQLLAKRRVQHYGYEFRYESRNVNRSKPPATPLPPEVLPIVQRIQALPNAPTIDQLTVNEYTPGVGLAPHIDTHSAFTGAIISLSLGGPAVMVMRREGEQRAVALPPRALLVMGGEARYAWEHYIPHRKSDVVAGQVVPRGPRRVSFTFRQVRGFPCDCAYPQYCDSQESTLPPTRMAALRGGYSGSSSSSAVSGRGEAAGPTAEAAQALWLSPEGVLASVPSAEGNAAGQQQQAEQQQAQQRQLEEQQQPAEVEQQPQAAQAQQRLPQAGEDASASTPDLNPSSSNVPGKGPAAAAEGSAGRDSGGGGGIDGAGALGLGVVEAELERLEEQFVHSVYDAIAPHFSATRFAVWPRVRDFIEALPAGGVVADVGCGNGKYFGVRRDLFVLGSDRSQGLAAVAARRLQPGPLDEKLRADVAVADALHLPYRPGCCDGVLCIAVLHHISSVARRLRLLGQLLELLAPGGRALVTVWATEQENMAKVAKWQPITTPAAAVQAQQTPSQAGSSAAAANNEAGEGEDPAGEAEARAGGTVAGYGRGGASSGDYFVPWHLPFHRAEAAAAAAAAAPAPAVGSASAGASVSEGQHLPGASAGSTAAGGGTAAPRVDRSKGTVVFQRYYHLFERGELDALVGQLPGARLVESFYDKDNWCAVIERLYK